MLTCIIIIIVIIIILLICGIVAYSYGGNQNDNNSIRYINGRTPFFDRMKSGFANMFTGGSSNKGKFTDGDIINNTWAIPPSLQPQNYWKHALMAQNISNMQGPQTDPQMFKYIYPLDGGSDINLGTKKCTGFGEDTVCENFYDYISNPNNVIQNNNLISGKISTAEQEMWLANRNDPSIAIEKNLGASFVSDPNADYTAYINSLVADNRMIDNHNKWVNEMKPWSGTARNVDNIDEALSNSVHWLGLRRPQPIAQGQESLFITELGPTNFINNPKFNFKA